MPEETEIQKLAEHALKFFTSKRRPPARNGDEGELFYLPTERQPVWIFDMMYDIHEKGRWFPDDYKYLYTVEALNYISEGNDPDSPELEADVYTSDLIKWLASHTFRPDYVDEAVKLHGWDDNGGIVTAIAWGQIAEREEVFREVVDHLNERLKAIENGEREVFRDRKGKPEGVMDWEPNE